MTSLRTPLLRSCLLLGLLAGCSVDPAPAELNPLARWYWLNFEEATDEQIHEGIRNLHRVVGQSLTDPLELSITRLESGDEAAAGLSGKDAPKAAGMLMMNRIRCPIEKLERLVIALNQKEMHGGYDWYERVYESSVDDYLSRARFDLHWRSAHTITALGTTYTATLPGGARWVPALEDAPSLGGPAFLVRAFLKEPGTFEEEDGDYFRQNYQAQVFYEESPGSVVHLFADWREMQISGFSSDGDMLVGTTLSKFVEADRTFEKICQQ